MHVERTRWPSWHRIRSGGLIASVVVAAVFSGIDPDPAPASAHVGPVPEPSQADADGAANRRATTTDGEWLVGPDSLGGEFADGIGEVVDLGSGWRLVSVDSGGDSEEVLGDLSKATPGAVVPNILLHPVVDPRFPEQWALENRGQTGGTPGADIGVTDAWEISRGRASVVVAVLDSGIDLDHPDLAHALWTNPDEVPGNGRDDDGNGRIDDVHGWDFISNDATPEDGTGHGTSVAGVISAAANNRGITGVAPRVTLMPLRVCTSTCPLSAIVAALSYAADQGADIVNMSFTGKSGDFTPIADVLSGDGAGMLAVASAGNDGVDIDTTPRYPASFALRNIVAVAATDDRDRLAYFTSYGNSAVDVGAPGHSVLTTTRNGKYGLVSGTSVAAPHVAGVAALVASVRPGLTPSELASLLESGVDPLPGLAPGTRWNGRLDAGNSLKLVAFGFIDTAASVFRDDIAWLASTGITKGCNPPANTVFCPTAHITRGQFAAMMRRALDLPPGRDAFRDDDNSVFAADIDALAAAGITKGCNPPDNDRFCPDMRVSRGEMASFLTRALDLPRAPPRFTDLEGSVHSHAIGALAAARITVGCNPPANTRFCPRDPVTRGQIAAFLHRADP